MRILVTGSKGMVGTALVRNLKNIKEKKNTSRPNIDITDIYEYDVGDEDKLDSYCTDCDFVFHLAGVNRTVNPEDYTTGNYGFSLLLLQMLKKHTLICKTLMPKKEPKK